MYCINVVILKLGKKMGLSVHMEPNVSKLESNLVFTIISKGSENLHYKSMM